MDNFEPRPFDSATIRVAIDGGHWFTFDVQDWDTDEGQPLDGESAIAMARGLICDDQVPLYGILMSCEPVHGAAQTNGVEGWAIIDPARVVAITIKPTGREAR
jgi:hypothetical protein